MFARVAVRYIDEGMPASALGILHPGIESNPEYVTGYVIAAKALVTLRHYNEARTLLARASTLLPDCPAVRALLTSIAELELTFPPDRGVFPENESTEGLAGLEKGGRQRRRLSKEDDLIAGSDELFRSPPEAPAPHEDFVSRQSMPDADLEVFDPPVYAHDEMEKLARILETARMPAFEADDLLFPGQEDHNGVAESIDLHTRPVTETLAEIYVRQGKTEEAIETYLTLCVRHPERREEFITRIAELQRSLEDYLDSGNS